VSTIEKAVQLAAKAHEGRKDKAGAPYILHLLRVMLAMSTADDMMAAVLHDIVEDTDTSLDDLRDAGFSDEIVRAIDALSRHRGELYESFTSRVAQNPMARRVKLADLEDNMDLTRFEKITDKDIDRWRKYLRAWRRLRG